MGDIHFGVQTYSWQMSYEKYRGRIDHIATIGAQAGFEGMEAEVCMLDTLFPDVKKVSGIMKENGLRFATLALPLQWLDAQETQEEKEMADKAIVFVKEMGDDCKLALCHLPQADRKDLEQRQKNQIACITQIARRAADAGVATCFHPNSSSGSAFRTREDYVTLLYGIAESPLGFAPDAGHIAYGDMDPLHIIKTYRDKIMHVHFKDMASDGTWQAMGAGYIDFPGIVSYLRDTDYDGWIMVEEESAKAAVDPDRVTLANGQYVEKLRKICGEEDKFLTGER